MRWLTSNKHPRNEIPSLRYSIPECGHNVRTPLISQREHIIYDPSIAYWYHTAMSRLKTSPLSLEQPLAVDGAPLRSLVSPSSVVAAQGSQTASAPHAAFRPD